MNFSKVKRTGRISKLKRAMRCSRNRRVVSSGVSGIDPSTEAKAAPHVDDVNEVEVKKRLVVSPLFRFCKDRKSNYIWRSVEAVLVKEYLDCFSIKKNGKLKDEIKLDISKVTSVDPLLMDFKLARKVYSLTAREAETIFKQPFAFVLSYQNDHFFFAAETEGEKNLWVSAVCQLIKSNRNKPSSFEKNNRVEASNTINYKKMERDALAEQARLRKQIHETEENIRSVSKKYEENDTKWRRIFQNLGYSNSSLDEE